MSYGNNNGENKYIPNQIERRTRATMLNEEQPKIDDVNILNNGNPSYSNINSDIQDQYDQAKEPSDEMIKLREYKQRQMKEFTNNYSISQVIPSGWTTFFNVVNSIFLTLALIIAFFVAFGLIFGLRIGIVPTASMEPTISVGSLVIIKPVEKVSDVHIGDILSYKRRASAKISYIHRVSTIGPISGENGRDTRIFLEGDNKDLPPGSHDDIAFRLVEGKMVLSIPVLGYVIAFIKDNIFLTIALFATLLISMLLIRSVVERKHARKEIDRFLVLKAEFEQQAEKEYQAAKKKLEDKEFERIMSTDFSNGQNSGKKYNRPNQKNSQNSDDSVSKNK